MNMKRTFWVATLVSVFLVAGAVSALAAGAPGSGVLGSVHDMRNWATDHGGNDRVCAFCHTPHHAADNSADYLPLWSRELNDTSGFVTYSSPTMQAVPEADVGIGPTRLCLSCHDGSVAIDQHYGATNTNGRTLTDDGWGGAGVAAGPLYLTNDHPIGFDYNAVAAGPEVGDVTPGTVVQITQDLFIRGAGALYVDSSWNLAIRDRLHEGTYMTCATCHDVHNKLNMDSPNQTANYLVLAPQKDSALCLTCHIK